MERIFTVELFGCSTRRMEQFNAISVAMDKLFKFFGQQVWHTHFAIINPETTYFYWHTDKTIVTLHLWKDRRIATVEIHTKAYKSRAPEIIRDIAKILKAETVMQQYRQRLNEVPGGKDGQ